LYSLGISVVDQSVLYLRYEGVESRVDVQLKIARGYSIAAVVVIAVFNRLHLIKCCETYHCAYEDLQEHKNKSLRDEIPDVEGGSKEVSFVHESFQQVSLMSTWESWWRTCILIALSPSSPKPTLTPARTYVALADESCSLCEYCILCGGSYSFLSRHGRRSQIVRESYLWSLSCLRSNPRDPNILGNTTVSTWPFVLFLIRLNRWNLRSKMSHHTSSCLWSSQRMRSPSVECISNKSVAVALVAEVTLAVALVAKATLAVASPSRKATKSTAHVGIDLRQVLQLGHGIFAAGV
jgi:hypothetical protein